MTPGPRVAATPALPVLLVIGNIPDWERSGRALPKGPGLLFIDFNGLKEADLRRIAPDVVISGLFGPGFDALDIASFLQKVGFSGRYRVIADRIPKPSLVKSEVRHVAPTLDFDVINLRGEIDAFL